MLRVFTAFFLLQRVIVECNKKIFWTKIITPFHTDGRKANIVEVNDRMNFRQVYHSLKLRVVLVSSSV